MIKILLTLVLLGGFTITLAQGSAQTSPIDAQIAAIQAAPASERSQMMNKFKQQIMQMNKKERARAIASIQSKMKSHANKSQTAQNHGSITQGKAEEHTQEMGQMQNMNQKQALSQFNQLHNNSGYIGTFGIKGNMGGYFSKH